MMCSLKAVLVKVCGCFCSSELHTNPMAFMCFLSNFHPVTILFSDTFSAQACYIVLYVTSVYYSLKSVGPHMGIHMKAGRK